MFVNNFESFYLCADVLFVLQERADNMKDQTFSDMYDSVKTSVKDMDDKIGTWLQEKTG